MLFDLRLTGLFTMNRFFFYLALGVLPAFGEPLGGHVAPITLYTSFQAEPPQAVVEALQDELGQIMGPIGLHFQWRSLAGVRGNEVSVELAVVTFKGRCDIASLAAHSVQPGALGWTHVSDGNILPFSDVDCDHIRRFIQAALLALSREDREEAFGRALGRVLAHELYHIFANTQKHGSCGVAKESYTVQDLMSDDFVFQDRDSQALRASKAHATLANAGSM
jgi:hypothetical protein